MPVLGGLVLERLQEFDDVVVGAILLVYVQGVIFNQELLGLGPVTVAVIMENEVPECSVLLVKVAGYLEFLHVF